MPLRISAKLKKKVWFLNVHAAIPIVGDEKDIISKAIFSFRKPRSIRSHKYRSIKKNTIIVNVMRCMHKAAL